MKTNVELKIELILTLDEVETLSALSIYATGLSRAKFEEIFGKKVSRGLNECLAIQLNEIVCKCNEASKCLYK